MKIRDINCSYSLIETNSPETLQKLINLLSVYVPGYQYTPQYKAGIWDGKQSFFKLIPQGMVIPKGLAELVIQKFSHMLEEPYQKCYNTEKITKEELLEFIKELNLPFEPRDYQIDAVLYALNNTNGIVISATGSGKSLMIYILLMYQYKKLNNKSLLIVPNVSLVEQMYNDFKDYGLTNIDETVHKIYSGKPKHFEKPITISTWQSIYKNKEMFEDIGCIVVDECHRARSESINTIIQASINSKYKIGFTGTLPDDNITRMSVIGALGKPQVIITPKQLIDMGYATPVYVNALFLRYNEEIDKSFRREAKTYQQEVKFIEKSFLKLL